MRGGALCCLIAWVLCPSLRVPIQEEGEDLATHFNLADNVFAEAIVKPSGTVCLWLGVRTIQWRRTCTAVLLPHSASAQLLAHRRCTCVRRRT